MKFLIILAFPFSLSFAPTPSFTSLPRGDSSSLLLSSNSYYRNEKYQIITDTVDNSSDDNDNNSSTSSNNNNDIINRRSALSTTTGIITSSILLSQIQPEQANAATDTPSTTTRNGPPIDVLVNKIEKGKYFGTDVIKMKNKEPQFVPNSNGAPEKHIPQIVLNTNVDANNGSTTTTVEMSANHVMKEDHYIQFMWLRDVTLDEVVLVKALTSAEERPVLKARVPNGVTLVPCLYCNLHGLWKGEEFTVA